MARALNSNPVHRVLRVRPSVSPSGRHGRRRDGRTTDGGVESVEAHSAGRRADGRRAVEEKGEREVSGKTRNVTAASVSITKR